MLAKGATHVTVVNLPDVSLSPFGQALDPATRAIVENMVTTFNGTLQATLGVNTRLLYIDAYSTSRAQFAAPAFPVSWHGAKLPPGQPDTYTRLVSVSRRV